MDDLCLVVGSVNVDLLGGVDRLPSADESAELSDFTLSPGGHAGNCAVAMARLGARVRLFASVGSDTLGELAVGALRASGVAHEHVQLVEGRSTGVVFIPVLRDGDKAMFLARGANEELDPERLPAARTGCCCAVVLDPPTHRIERIASDLAGLPVVFAPGRLAFAAPSEALAPLLRLAALVVVNRPEARRLTGEDDPEGAAEALAARWRTTAIVTAGAEGCVWARLGAGARRAAGFPVEARDATGAGDAFVAALAVSLLQRMPLPIAIRRACAAGALATRAFGAQASLATAPELDALATPRRGLRAGADGWRGRIGQEFTLEVVDELAERIGAELRDRVDGARVLVTCDGRELSGAALHRAALGLASAGMAPTVAGRLPTPVATFAVRELGFSAALLITASHNPPEWNGVKLKVPPGMPATRELESAIGRALPRRLDRIAHPAIETVPAAEIEEAFVAGLLERIDTGSVRRAASRGLPIRCAVDGLGGIAGPMLARVATAAGAIVEGTGLTPSPSFDGLVPDPMVAASRERIAGLVEGRGFALGLLTDGDGDRLGVVDERGRFVRPHDVLALVLPRALELEREPGAIAATAATGTIVRRLAERLGRACVTTPIGFKHIAPLLRTGEAAAGGGGVGDFGLRRLGCDRDPLVLALLLLVELAEAGRPLGELVDRLHDDLGPSCFEEVSLPARSSDLATLERIGRSALHAAGLDGRITSIDHIDGVRFLFGRESFLLLRTASTEEVTRIHVESESRRTTAALVDALRTALQEEHAHAS
jgi:phosphomannomutase/fructose-1-phosphate kinase PfkB-like protein